MFFKSCPVSRHLASTRDGQVTALDQDSQTGLKVITSSLSKAARRWSPSVKHKQQFILQKRSCSHKQNNNLSWSASGNGCEYHTDDLNHVPPKVLILRNSDYNTFLAMHSKGTLTHKRVHIIISYQPLGES